MQVRDVFTFFFFFLPLVLCYLITLFAFFSHLEKKGDETCHAEFRLFDRDCARDSSHHYQHHHQPTSPRSRPTWSGRWGRGATGEIASDFWQNKTRSQTLDSGDAAERRALMM